MRFTARLTDIRTSDPFVMMCRDDCLKLGVDEIDRVRITGGSTTISSVAVSDSDQYRGTVMMPQRMMERCSVSDGDEVDIVFSPLPESVRSIRKKINGGKLSAEEIGSIVSDIQDGGLSDREILSFVSAFNVNNSDLEEVAALTRAMASTGDTVDFGIPELYDFHSLGGIPGNKITPIVVSIVASQGLVIPKLSSRAISSACGTSDFVETFCRVELGTEELKSAVREAGGVFACGNEDYAPVGRRIISAERPMGIDPRPMMLASIMSKKVALGTNNLLIDIPMGDGSKIEDMTVAEEFARDLIGLGKELGMRVECAVTCADQPIGITIGPVLEARECIRILEDGDGERSVIDKACGMAGMLLEMGGISGGEKLAREILRSGKAHGKFLEIVRAQGGKDVRSSDLVPGAFVKDIHAKRTGYVEYIDNPCIVAIAKGAGAPFDPGAGIELLHKKGDFVHEGDVLFRIYAENETKLERATDSARSRRPMLVGTDTPSRIADRMIIRRFGY